MMIWIRADANKEIGSGHIMRCLSIAAALKECGQEVCFILADESAEELLKARGMDYQILYSAYDNTEKELEQLESLLAEQKPELLLIDSYFVTANYLKRLRELVKVVYVDDIPRFPYPVDGIINYNIYGDGMPYEEMAAVTDQRLILGPTYAPLREQFQNIDYKVCSVAENVLLTTGGSDKYNLACKILEEVLANEKTVALQYHVVSGVFNPHFHILEEMAQQHENIHLYRNVTDMAGLMQKCDIAITAGGSTMYELCAIGVPTLCFSFVDNQELIVESFYQKEMVFYGGNYLKEQEHFTSNVTKALAILAEDKKLREAYSNKARALVDGQGAHRIATALCEMI